MVDPQTPPRDWAEEFAPRADLTAASTSPKLDRPAPKTTNGDLGRAAYEAWMRERQTQPDPPSPRAWDDLTESTQRYWNKEAMWRR